MRVVYALTKGSYSDYGVLALFASRQDAEDALKAAEERADGDWLDVPDGIEAMRFYDEGEEPQIVTTHHWQVNVWDNGTTTDERKDQYREWEYDTLHDPPANGRPKVRFVRAPIHRDKGGRLEVTGTDEQAVAQSYSDNLARLLADADYRLQSRSSTHTDWERVE